MRFNYEIKKVNMLNQLHKKMAEEYRYANFSHLKNETNMTKFNLF